MSRSIHQDQVKAYHEHLRNNLQLDMFVIHEQWHQQNLDPNPELLTAKDAKNWEQETFGTLFLEMHHGMLHTTPSGGGGHSGHAGHPHHPGIFDWYATKGFDLPGPWSGEAPIPADLDFEPDLDDLGPTMRNKRVQRFGAQAALQRMQRNPNYGGFQLPGWATEQGIQKDEDAELYTGATKLGDFKNTNQLGSCLVFPHNAWHGRIGGAMSSTATAIADPVFYFGVHKAIDDVYQRFLQLQNERLRAPAMFPAQARPARPFTEAEMEQATKDRALSLSLNEQH